MADNKAPEMEYRHLGRTGLRVSTFSLGFWATYGVRADEDTALECMQKAYDAGINFFDNAETYGKETGQAEIVMGNCIKRGNFDRTQLVISTKLFWGGKGPNQRGLSRKHLIEGLNASLKRLQLDYVDLLYCHRPDFHTPIEETVRAMNYLIDQGKTFYWGTSEWTADQITAAIECAKRLNLIGPSMEQPQYSLLSRERFEKEYSRLYTEYGYGTTIWSPLASGVLTGKYNNGVPDGSRFSGEDYAFLRKRYMGDEWPSTVEKLQQLEKIAQELGCSMAQLSLAWCAKNPNVSSVITGASRVSQLEENLKALAVVPKLTPEIMQKIDQLFPPPTPHTDYR